MVGVVDLGSEGLEFKSHSVVELIPGGVNSACHPSEVGKMSVSMLAGILCQGGDTSRIVSNSQGDCLSSTNALQSMVPMDEWNLHPGTSIMFYHSEIATLSFKC